MLKSIHFLQCLTACRSVSAPLAEGDYVWQRCFTGPHYVQLREKCSLLGTQLLVKEKETSPGSSPKICLLSWVSQLGSCPLPQGHLKYPPKRKVLLAVSSSGTILVAKKPQSISALRVRFCFLVLVFWFFFMQSSPDVLWAVSQSTACP